MNALWPHINEVHDFHFGLRLVISKRLKKEMSQRAVAESFIAYASEPLSLPEDAALPDLAFLAEHRAKVFRAA